VIRPASADGADDQHADAHCRDALAVHGDASVATLGAGGDAAAEASLWFTGTSPTRRYAGTSSGTLASASRLWKNENWVNLTAPGGIAFIAPASAGRRLRVERHVVAVGEAAEQLVPGLSDMLGMLDQGIGVDVALTHLALGSVVLMNQS
jgi:hypothetical protein